MGKAEAIARLLRRARGEAADAFDNAVPDIGEEVSAEPVARAEAPDGEDGLDLEAGIASIFARIRSGGGGGPEELPEDTGATYALLSQLNQLWQSPRPGEA